jgi:hypothetical protein
MKIIIGVLVMVVFTESLFWYRDTVDRRMVLKSIVANRDEWEKMYDSVRENQPYTSFMYNTIYAFCTEDSCYVHLGDSGVVEWTQGKRTIIYTK